jgi:hypothetical protein
MKKNISKLTLLLVLHLLISVLGNSQTPNQFKYQAVLRDASGGILASQAKTIVIAILQGSITGTIVFTETHNVTTTAQGIINLNIGIMNTTGFANINWAGGPYFIKITVGGVEMGTSQLLSVPYALYAKTAGNGFSGNWTDLVGKPTIFSGSYNDLINKPALFDGTWASLTGKPTLFDGSWTSIAGRPSTIAGYGITDAFNGTWNA